MKTIKWNDPDPRVVWDNPNLRWGSPSYLLEEGDPGYVELQPGQPGYVPPSPKPVSRPTRRRRAAAAADPEPHSSTPSMDTNLHFNVVPLASGGYTTRLVAQEDVLTPELVALTAAALAARGLNLTPEQITAAGEELAKVQLRELARGRPIRRAFGLFTYEATTGGRHQSPDFIPTLDNMTPAVRGRLSPEGQALFDSLISFERESVLGGKTPEVTRVYDGATRALDRITLGGPFRLSGPESFGPEIDPAVSALGIFLERTDGTPARVAMFSRWTESEIFGSWPAAISGTGPAELRVVTKYPGNTSPSTFVYGTPLPIVP